MLIILCIFCCRSQYNDRLYFRPVQWLQHEIERSKVFQRVRSLHLHPGRCPEGGNDQLEETEKTVGGECGADLSTSLRCHDALIYFFSFAGLMMDVLFKLI